MTTRVQALLPLFLFAALSACGGGDSGPTPAPVPVPAPISVIPVVPIAVTNPPVSPAPTPVGPSVSLRFTQADMQTNTALGATNQILAGNYTSVLLGFFVPLLQDLSNEVSGIGNLGQRSCVINNQGSGTFTLFANKSGVRLGLAPGDTMRFNFINCRLGTSAITFNGNAAFTAQSLIAGLSSTSYDMAFRATFDDYSVSLNNSPLRFSGVIIGTSKLDGVTTNYGFTVPAGEFFSVNGAGLTTRYLSSVNFSMSNTTTPNTFSRRLNGDITLQTTGTPVALTLQVTTALSGTRSASGTTVPTSGSFTTRNTGMNLLTSASINGAVVSVSGDSDSNGTLDLVFSTTWAALSN